MTYFFKSLFSVTFYYKPWNVLNLHICDVVNRHLVPHIKCKRAAPKWTNEYTLDGKISQFYKHTKLVRGLTWSLPFRLTFNVNEYLR